MIFFFCVTELQTVAFQMHYHIQFREYEVFAFDNMIKDQYIYILYL